MDASPPVPATTSATAAPPDPAPSAAPAGPITAARPGVVSTALAGALVGTVYGVSLRGWMRLVSTDPEFSWSGTGFIVAVFAVLGTTAGLVSAARRRGWGRRRVLGLRTAGIVLGAGCFTAAGAAMFPTVIPAALGLARTDWRRSVRVGLVVVGVVAATALVLTMPGLAPGRRALALALYLVLCAVEAGLWARLFVPTLPPGTLSRRTVVVLWSLVALLLAGTVVMATGLSI